MSRVLVTGGAGFIGCNLVEYLATSTQEQVTVLDSMGYAADRTFPERARSWGVRLVVGDVADAALLDELLPRCDRVIHLAAQTHNDNSLESPRPFLHSNVVATFELLEAVRRHGVALHHVSTDEVFGDLELEDPARFTETSPYMPSSPYSATKAASDLLVRAWVRSFGIHATLSNCSNNYGPYQHVEKFIPRQITSLLTGAPARLYGDGRHVRDWIHVRDHVRAVWEVATRGRSGEAYLVGADGECSNAQVLAELVRIMGHDGPPEHVRDRPGHDRRYAIDPSRVRDELGWRPEYTDLASGLEQTVLWYRQHRAWWEPLKAGVERDYAMREGRA